MYFTHKFRDREVKAEGVRENTVDMVFSYFWDEAVRTTATPGHLAGMTNEDVGLTKAIIREWVLDNPTANLEQLADFTSRLVTDYKENLPTEGEWNE